MEREEEGGKEGKRKGKGGKGEKGGMKERRKGRGKKGKEERRGEREDCLARTPAKRGTDPLRKH